MATTAAGDGLYREMTGTRLAGRRR